MEKKRALWLMNHRTLRAFEVPMLIDMGYEVYCPKMFPYDEGNMSASVDYQYDETLTIPAEVLNELNKVDFYKEVPCHILDLMNKYFDIALFGFFPEQLKMLVEGFKGILVMQPFGLSNDMTYTAVIEQTLGISFIEKMQNLGERFFFGQSYENIAEIECRFFQTRSMYLPLGLKDAYVNDNWVGGDNRILFVCPRINTSPYFNNIYSTFKKDFKGFDYVIGGAQPIEVTSDSKVAGFIPNEQYTYNMTHLSVMYYHSREKRHLHYHPLEAVKNGMPLIYMNGGLLEEIAGKKLIGSCDTIKEARRKISRIMSGDKSFIKKVKQEQEVLLKPFQYDYCIDLWNKEFTKVERAIEKNRAGEFNSNKPKRIGILLSEGYTGGVMDYTLRFVNGLIKGIKENHKNVELIFGHLDHDNFKKKDYFASFRDQGIPIRSFRWKFVDEDYINTVLNYKGLYSRFEKGKYCLADDGADYFEDCDYLIFCIDRVPEMFFSLKPYLVVSQDYIQRYMPEQFGKSYEKSIIELQRHADKVLVTTIPALEDAIQYAGLPKNKLVLTPLLFDEISVESCSEKTKSKDYFLWSTNLGRHKNHLNALKGLADYYEKGGKLECFVTGVGTDIFDVKKKFKNDKRMSAYIKDVREVIEQNSDLKKHLHFCGNMNKVAYLNILKNAKYFLHTGFTDNGNMTSIDAAFLGVPTISSDYPAMRYYEDVIHLNMRFFNPFDPKTLSKVLLETDNDYAEFAKSVPDYDTLKKFSISCTYRKLYDIIMDILKL